MNDVAQSVLNFLIENTLVFSALFTGVLCVRVVFKKHLSALAQYVLWGVVVLKLLIPVSFASFWNPYDLLPSVPTAIQAEAAYEAPAGSMQTGGSTGEVPGLPGLDTEDRFAPKINYSRNLAESVNAASASGPVKIDWALFAAAAWILGIALNAAWLRLKTLSVRRKIGRTGTGEIPEWMQAVYDKCREELGVKKEIRLVIQGILHVPAIMGVWHPMLIVPERLLEEKDIGQLRHVFTHELMHYRRKDLLVKLVLNILNAVYWFNPLVWVCFRAIERDMETACDAMVVEALGRRERKAYILTILKFSGKRETLRTQAAMSLNDGCIHMKKRIKGMYLASKTKKTVRFAVIALSCLMAFAAFTTGCQPTPEKPVVQNKAESRLEEKIQETSAPESRYDAPKTLNESFNGKDKRVKINLGADVSVPAVASFPVVEIVPDDVSLDFVGKAAQVLLEGKPVYEPKTALTKSELQTQILDLQKTLADPKHSSSDGLNADDPQIVADTKKMFQERIKIFQELMKMAPAENERKEAKLEFHPSKYYEDPAMYAENVAMWKSLPKDDQAQELLDQYEDVQKIVLDAELDNGYYGTITAENYDGENDRWNRITFAKSKTLGTRPKPYIDWSTVGEAKITEEDAAKMGQELLSKLGIEGMGLSELYPMESQAAEGSDGKIYGYSLYYQREYAGVGAIDEEATEGLSSEERYGPMYRQEYIKISIADDQVASFEWQSPSKQVRVENANVELKPFDEILGAFKQQMSVEYTLEKLSRYMPENPDYKEYVSHLVSGKVDIKSVKLGMVRLAVKDKPGAYRMVPAWKFYGSEEIKSDGKGQSDMDKDKAARIDDMKAKGALKMVYNSDKPNVYQTINAIDGSIIDWKKGY